MHSETVPVDTQHTAILKIWQALYKERNLPPEKAPQELDQRYFRPILKYSYENYDDDEPFNCTILLLERKSDGRLIEPTLHFKLDCDSAFVVDNFLGEDFGLPQHPVGIHYHIRKVQAHMSRHYRDMRQEYHQRLSPPEREAKAARIETFRQKVAEQTTVKQSAIDGAPDDKCPGCSSKLRYCLGCRVVVCSKATCAVFSLNTPKICKYHDKEIYCLTCLGHDGSNATLLRCPLDGCDQWACEKCSMWCNRAPTQGTNPGTAHPRRAPCNKCLPKAWVWICCSSCMNSDGPICPDCAPVIGTVECPTIATYTPLDRAMFSAHHIVCSPCVQSKPQEYLWNCPRCEKLVCGVDEVRRCSGCRASENCYECRRAVAIENGEDEDEDDMNYDLDIGQEPWEPGRYPRLCDSVDCDVRVCERCSSKPRGCSVDCSAGCEQTYCKACMKLGDACRDCKPSEGSICKQCDGQPCGRCGKLGAKTLREKQMGLVYRLSDREYLDDTAGVY